MVDDRDFTAQAEIFKALGDKFRLTILATLAASRDPICVCDLVDGLPINQSSVSHHLAILKDAGLVMSERRGTWAYYSLVAETRERVIAAVDYAMPKRRTRLARAS